MRAQSRIRAFGGNLCGMIPIIALGMLAVPATATQDAGAAADGAREAGAGQITEILRRQGDQESPTRNAGWCDLNPGRSGDAPAPDTAGRSAEGDPVRDNFCPGVAPPADDHAGPGAGPGDAHAGDAAQARTGGFEAEYSGATGGVVSRATGSGQAPVEIPPPAKKAPPEG